MPPKIRGVLQQLREAGWQQVQQTGSHRQFKHPVHPGRVTGPVGWVERSDPITCAPRSQHRHQQPHPNLEEGSHPSRSDGRSSKASPLLSTRNRVLPD